MRAKTWQEERIAKRECWACGADTGGYELCWSCGAPPYAGEVDDGMYAGPGVYVIRSSTGLLKIGESNKSIRTRVKGLPRETAKSYLHCGYVACFPDASLAVERWLHALLGASRDPMWARAEGLPHPTEWFWPNPSLTALLSGRHITARTLYPELAAFDAPLFPEERALLEDERPSDA